MADIQKILLTWYGITDLKASLGLEKSNGPILNALLAEKYSQAIILGFTDQSKKLETSEKAVHIHINDLAQDELIPRLSNTQMAHSHFKEWLEGKLLQSNVNTNVIMNEIHLRHLNDTEGIYDAANKIMNTITPSEKITITFYVSPGTPVMAFVWAFVALRYPNVRKRLISSSTGGKPEIVRLPEEWIEWHGRQVYSNASPNHTYDVIFHLFGEQRMPSLLGMFQFESSKHIFVNSSNYPASVMKQFAKNAIIEELNVNAFNPDHVKTAILDEISKMPASTKIGFNLTGGTKLMYAGAFSACKKVNATPFYFDGIESKVIFLNDFTSEPIVNINSVETFINLNADGLTVSNPGLWQDIHGINHSDRAKLTEKLWLYRNKIAPLYSKIISKSQNFASFQVAKGSITINFDNCYNATIQIDDNTFKFENWKDFGKYITGGWFEEYTYSCLKPLVENGDIKDIRIGLELSIAKNTTIQPPGLEALLTMNSDTYQELDILFTDGKKLFIIECKAGQVKSDHIMKLQNIVRYFGGIESKGVLAACFPPESNTVKKKISDSKSINLIAGKDFSKNIIKEVLKLIGKPNNESNYLTGNREITKTRLRIVHKANNL